MRGLYIMNSKWAAPSTVARHLDCDPKKMRNQHVLASLFDLLKTLLSSCTCFRIASCGQYLAVLFQQCVHSPLVSLVLCTLFPDTEEVRVKFFFLVSSYLFTMYHSSLSPVLGTDIAVSTLFPDTEELAYNFPEPAILRAISDNSFI